jgi:5'-3' exonuclease
MGVPRFFRWLQQNGYIGSKTAGNLPSNVSGLSVDMNSIIHETAQEVWGYGSGENEDRLNYIKTMIETGNYKDIETEHFEAIANRIIDMIKKVQPSDYLILAVDGVAPQAKISQQRSRRYKGAMDKLTSGKIYYFDNNSITPGTEFMIRLDKYMQRFITGIVNLPINPPTTIYYFNHLTPGEGEHKIMRLLKDREIVDPELNHVVHGLDADLIFLCLLLPIDKMYLWREDTQIRDNRTIYRTNIVDISELRLNITDSLALNLRVAERDRIRTAMHDFVLMMFLMGNDFIPHHPALGDFEDAISYFIRAYENTNLPLTNKDGIIWDNFYKFIVVLYSCEKEMLRKQSKKVTTFPSRFFEVAKGKSGKFDYGKYRGVWYYNEFYPTGAENLPPGMTANVTVNDITRMCNSYLVTLGWNFMYYTVSDTSINLDWYYSYYHAPLFRDLAPALKSIVEGDRSMFDIIPRVEGQLYMSPPMQLLSVLPPDLNQPLPFINPLLPVEVVEYLRDPNCNLRDLLPLNFIVEYDGMFAEWMGIPILPFVDPDRIRYTFELLIQFRPEREAIYATQNLVGRRIAESIAMGKKTIQKQREMIREYREQRKRDNVMKRRTARTRTYDGQSVETIADDSKRKAAWLDLKLLM